MSNDPSNKDKGLLGAFASHAATRSIADALPKGGLAAALRPADIFGKRTVDGLYFLNKKMVLDGYSFIGCRFDNCTLVVNTSNFDITNCIIDASCTIEYGHEVAKVIQLFNSRYPQANQFFAPPFVPMKNPDGTISITPGVR